MSEWVDIGNNQMMLVQEFLPQSRSKTTESVMSEWKLVKDCQIAKSSDEDAEMVILSNQEGDISLGVVYLRKDGTRRGVAGMFSGVVWTHWMPLPSPPK